MLGAPQALRPPLTDGALSTFDFAGLGSGGRAAARKVGEGMHPHRLESLTDSVFAVAMTLLVFDLRIPNSTTYASFPSFALRARADRRV